MIEQPERRFDARAEETFEAAIARANAWLQSVLDSAAGEALVLEWGKDFDGLVASPPVAIKVAGPPAHFGEVAMLEAWLHAPLPPSYRRFLKTLGQVAFMHRPARPTYAIGTIKAVTEVYREMTDEWFEGYDQEGFGADWGSAGVESGYRSWRDWPGGSGVFHPDEVKHKNFVPICPGYEKDAHLLALHLADASGEAPVFQNFPDDGAAFLVRGATFDAWMSSMVDELIGSLSPDSPSGVH
jgi:hypothetical protein